MTTFEQGPDSHDLPRHLIEGAWVPALPDEPYRCPMTGEYLMVVEVRRGSGGEEWRMARLRHPIVEMETTGQVLA